MFGKCNHRNYTLKSVCLSLGNGRQFFVDIEMGKAHKVVLVGVGLLVDVSLKHFRVFFFFWGGRDSPSFAATHIRYCRRVVLIARVGLIIKLGGSPTPALSWPFPWPFKMGGHDTSSAHTLPASLPANLWATWTLTLWCHIKAANC